MTYAWGVNRGVFNYLADLASWHPAPPVALVVAPVAVLVAGSVGSIPVLVDWIPEPVGWTAAPADWIPGPVGLILGLADWARRRPEARFHWIRGLRNWLPHLRYVG